MTPSAHDTIVAPATASGGALAVIRLSGDEALAVCDRIFRGRRPLAQAQPYTLHYGRIVDTSDEPESGSSEQDVERTTSADIRPQQRERIIDDVVISVFRSPHSYTGEDVVEISCHGSSYIVSEVLRLSLRAGARMARPGEFTERAFLAGRMDLSQAEAVADLIASSSQTAHALASAQMRGGYSDALKALREELVHLMSLLELELDFSEEDVEFADRSELRLTMQRLDTEIQRLRDSFSLGNALKRGVAVALVGAPNVGKSTLLNRLLGEERAMVSEIAGTTRDAIEETVDIDGVLFRFIDTAGLRRTNDRLEQMGIERTRAAIARAQILIHMRDAEALGSASVREEEVQVPPGGAQHTIEVVNKMDRCPDLTLPVGAIGLSAREGKGIEALRKALRKAVDTERLYQGDTVVSSARHYEALASAHLSLSRALEGLDQHLSTDLLSEELRSVLYYLGTITGEITTDEILGNIFSKFCIGK